MCLAVPGRVLAIEDGCLRLGRVDFDGTSLEVCLAYVPEARPGDYVLVHAGFALARLDEDQARQTLDLLDQLDQAGGAAPSGGDRRIGCGDEPLGRGER